MKNTPMTQYNYADLCECGHTLIAHVHYNGDLGLPADVTTYCGAPQQQGKEVIECECATFKPKPKPSGDEILLSMIKNSASVSDLSDGELIDECLDEFSDLSIASRKDALLQELLTRFQKAICLDETPKGITADGEPLWAEEIQ